MSARLAFTCAAAKFANARRAYAARVELGLVTIEEAYAFIDQVMKPHVDALYQQAAEVGASPAEVW
jgi:hypothetical protein